MSFIEERKKKGSSYYYLVKKLKTGNKTTAFKIGIGSSPNISKEKFILDNIILLTDKELSLRNSEIQYLQKNLTHQETLPKKIITQAITIQNVLEAKKCEKTIYTEYAKEFIFNSNNIEGSKIAPEKVKEIIETGNTSYDDKNEIKEVKNSIKAFEYLITDFTFNIRSIKRLYYILTKDLLRDGNQAYPKGFKKEHNVVGNSETTPPEKVEEALKNLLSWYHKQKKSLHPFELAFEFHARYERIHPFLDGNGRTGRLLMNKILISNGFFPIIVY
ncbi:MAG: Fic family protein, partial [Candidatus Woesearchaeota archaeon]